MTTMTRAANPEVLEQALAQECDSARAFCALLQRERTALTDGDLEQVFTLANDKLELATRLRKQADLRESLLTVLSDRRSAGDPFAQWPHLAARWQQLRDLLATAGEANRINGLIVNSRLIAIGGAIAALRGSVDDSAIYGRDGSTTVHGGTTTAHWAA